MSDAGVGFHVLGPLNIRLDQQLLPVTGLKNRTVISCLALHPEESVSVDRLLRAAWGDPPPKSAKHQVRKMISALRLTLHTDWDSISTSSEGYLLKVSQAQSDLVTFQALYSQVMSDALTTDQDLATAYSALALWRGQPCEGSLPLGCEVRVADLQEQHRILLLKTLRAFGERGREDELIAVLQVAGRIHGDDWRPLDRGRGPGLQPPATTGASSTSSGQHSHRRSAAPTLRCLPRDLNDFSAREQEVAELEGFFETVGSGSRVSTIHGMGGVGKSTLAVHVAHRIADRYPDGQFFVSLDGRSSPGSISVNNTLGVLLRQAGLPEDEIPSSEESRLALWRSLTADRRMLVVLDDAASLDDVEPVLPVSRHSACLVTSRLLLSGLDSTLCLRLEVPDRTECLDMLASMVGRERVDEAPEAARSLVDLFEQLPLALRLAAARLTTREFTSLDEVFQALHESVSPVAELDLPGRSVSGRLRSSLTAMEPFDLYRYAQISLIPGPEIDDNAVAAALRITVGQARQTCRRLVDRSLLQRIGSCTYKIHTLLAETVRAHVDSTFTAAEQRTVVADAMAYYSETSGLVGSVRVNPSPVHAPGVVYGTLLAAAKESERLGLEPSFVDLCLAWERSINMRLDVNQQQEIWSRALTLAPKNQDHAQRGQMLLAVSRCHWHSDRIGDGVAALEQAWTEAEAADDDLLRVRVLIQLSSFCWLDRRAEDGLEHLMLARAVLAKFCEKPEWRTVVTSDELEITSNESALLVVAGRFEEAIELARSVLVASGPDSRVIITARVTEAAALLGLQRYGEAVSAAAEALDEANTVNSAYGRAFALRQTSEILRNLPRPDLAAATVAAHAGRRAAEEAGSYRLKAELDGILGEDTEA